MPRMAKYLEFIRGVRAMRFYRLERRQKNTARGRGGGGINEKLRLLVLCIVYVILSEGSGLTFMFV